MGCWFGNNTCPIVNPQVVSQCPGTTYTVASNIYSTPGVYYDTLLGQGANGCDSVIITNLGFFSVSNDTMNTNICVGDSATLNGVNYFSSNGFYTDTLTSAFSGCDSIVSMNLMVNSPSTSNPFYTECEGFVLNVGTSSYSTNGFYIDTLINAGSNGCDSIVWSTLTIVNSSTNTQTINLCDGESILVGTNVYNSSGNYVDTLSGMASNGCDSIVTTNLTISSPVDASVTNDIGTTTITANNATASSYQWIDCASGMPLSGETGQSLLVTENGSFAVIVSEGNCTDTSACETYATIGIDELIDLKFDVLPNPSSGKFTIKNVSNQFGTYDLKIVNLLGQTVYSKNSIQPNKSTTITLNNKGVYFVEISNKTERLSKKMVVR